MSQPYSPQATDTPSSHGTADLPGGPDNIIATPKDRMMVSVIQADRDAAADLMTLAYIADGMPEHTAKGLNVPVRQGRCDHSNEVQTFARHRINAVEEAATVAEARAPKHDLTDWTPYAHDVDDICRTIAKNIRALASEGSNDE